MVSFSTTNDHYLVHIHVICHIQFHVYMVIPLRVNTQISPLLNLQITNKRVCLSCRYSSPWSHIKNTMPLSDESLCNISEWHFNHLTAQKSVGQGMLDMLCSELVVLFGCTQLYLLYLDMAVWTKISQNMLNWLSCFDPFGLIFLYFCYFYILHVKNLKKWKFKPAFGVCNTQTLVKIYNNCLKLSKKSWGSV